MKAVILAGGMGTRIREETEFRPKPLVEIGGKPIIWHIMKIYSAFGINEFIVCLGYKGNLIKEYFANYSMHMCDMTVDIATGQVDVLQNQAEPWRVTLIDTGEATMTGGRLKRIAPHLAGEDAFCMTYGDGVSNVPIDKLIEFHRGHGRLATLTAVRPTARFGAVEFDRNGRVKSFLEKPKDESGLVNGGFFVLSPKVIDYIDGDSTNWEGEPLESLVRDQQLHAFPHDGFWQPMDTIRDRQLLEELWAGQSPPWKLWA